MRLLGFWILAFGMVSVPVDAAGNSVRKGLIPLAFPSWVELGPNPIPNGQTSPVNAVSGRVTAIEIVPDDPTTIFVATSFGGVIGIGADSAFGGTIPNHGMAGLYRLGNVTGAPASVTVTKIGLTSATPCYDSPCTGNRDITDMVLDPV